ncbi:helix-turn-helix domain-containing protein [Leptolyngbya ohadii]|uniref:helix-turn-helix domain-containing protein n=1 Tax=Leptolyngbya ohadii TaxID=1962290 RepID=UPI000B59F291|nr:helix-turn-helix transcriptional regulator [Leptolyngbya ohadii]
MEITETQSIPDRFFTSCDRYVINSPHQNAVQTKEDCSALDRMQQMVTQFKHKFKHNFKDTAREEGLINLTVDGQILFMNPRAEHLLSQYFLSLKSSALPDSLIHWFRNQPIQCTFQDERAYCFSLQIKQAERQLNVYLMPSFINDQYLLVMDERKLPSFSTPALEMLGLTKREAEVLFWIAKDKSNAGIAKVLDCCEGTVRKHLENLYKKLGVQTRIGAVMVALEKLGLLEA